MMRPPGGCPAVARAGPDQAAVGGCVVSERPGQLTAGDQGGRETVVPARDAFGRAQDLLARGGRVAVRRAVAGWPQVQYRVRLQAQPGDPGDQAGHVGQRDALGTAGGAGLNRP